MTTNLYEKLKASRTVEFISNSEARNASIMENYQEDDKKLVKRAGFRKPFENMSSVGEKRKTVSDLDPERIFHIDDIKRLCVNYRLKFLHTGLYNGEMDAGIPAAISELESRLNKDIDGDAMKIVAPIQSFDLSENPWDPIMFYDLGNDMWYMVHKWGQDISALRWLTSLKWRSYWTWAIASLITYWIPLACLILWIGGTSEDSIITTSVLCPSGYAIHFLIARFFCGDRTYSYLELATSSDYSWSSKHKNTEGWFV